MKDRQRRNRKNPSGTQTVQSAPDRISRVLEIPQNAFTAMSQIELIGNREAVVEGCHGVLEYDENIVKLSLHNLVIKFTGRSLQIRSMTSESLIVEGFITNIEFM